MSDPLLRACTPFGRVSNAPIMIKKKISKQCRQKNESMKKKTPQKKLLEVSPTLQQLQGIVINLDRREDRLLECSKVFLERAPWLRHCRFRASDGRTDDIPESDVTLSWNTANNVKYQKLRAIRKGWNDFDSYQPKILDHSRGERGCSASHIRAWKYCLEHAGENGKPLLVLEDDAKPIAGFTEILEEALKHLPENRHVLYLGYSQAADWRREISENLVEAEYVWTTVAYIIWPAGARILLDRLPVDQPVDNWMASACAAGALNAFCVKPKIIHQAEAWNINSDVGHSDEVGSDIHHSDPFYPGLQADGDAVIYGSGSDSSDDDMDDSGL